MTFYEFVLDNSVRKLRRGHIAFAASFLVMGVISATLAGEREGSAAPSHAPPTAEEIALTVSGGGAPEAPDEESQSPNAGSAATVAVAPKVAQTVKVDGKPFELVAFDDFSTPVQGIAPPGWHIYDTPTAFYKRYPENINVKDGILNVTGTYRNGINAGSGVSQDFDQMYGRWEIRMRADVGAGFSPTMLLWPKSERWPEDGEIDIIESPYGNRLKPMSVIHNGVRNRTGSKGYSHNASEWHTYTVEWLPNRVTIYIDGKEHWNVTDKALVPSKSPMHVALQLDSGCAWIECPNKTTPEVLKMQIDWVKVYATP
jgi:beta-glucanase (GH16 family)